MISFVFKKLNWTIPNLPPLKSLWGNPFVDWVVLDANHTAGVFKWCGVEGCLRKWIV